MVDGSEGQISDEPRSLRQSNHSNSQVSSHGKSETSESHRTTEEKNNIILVEKEVQTSVVSQPEEVNSC